MTCLWTGIASCFRLLCLHVVLILKEQGDWFAFLCESVMLNKGLLQHISLLLAATLTELVVLDHRLVLHFQHLRVTPWSAFCSYSYHPALASFLVCFHFYLCTRRSRIPRRSGVVLYYLSVVMSERSWQHLWTYWSYPMVPCLTSGGGGKTELGSTQTHTSSLEPPPRVCHLALRHQSLLF